VGLFRKVTSASTLGMVKFQSNKEKQASAAARTSRAHKKTAAAEAELLRAQAELAREQARRLREGGTE
jgi:hypothetical protein